MSLYLIAASKEAMARNEGVEIMASGISEALDKYEVMGGECVPRGDGYGSTWTRMPDGFELETFIEFPNEIKPPEDDDDEDDEDDVTCPKCGCCFDCYTLEVKA